MSTTTKAFSEFVDSATVLDLMELAKFTHVVPGTVLTWVDKRELPKGETHIRLLHYLDAGRSQLDELKELPKPAYKLGQLIAFGLLAMDEARERLGYASQNDLLRLLRGSSLQADRGQILTRLIADHQEQLNVVITAFREQHQPQPQLTPEPERLAPLQSNNLSTKILSSTVMGGVDLLHIALDLVDLQADDVPTALQLTLPERSRIERLITRLKVMI
jgi:hypothetical protein